MAVHRPLRPVGAGPARLFLVEPRRMAAPPVVHRCPNDVLALAETCAQASACTGGPRQGHGPDTGRRAVAADTRAKSAAAGQARPADALLPSRLSCPHRAVEIAHLTMVLR